MGKAFQKQNGKLKGYLFMGLWAIFIISGIVAKRVYGHPDWMVFFHFPAAVFLVLGWRSLSHKIREQYQKDLQIMSLSKD